MVVPSFILRNPHSVFLLSALPALYPHLLWTRVPSSPHPRQPLLFVLFLIITILNSVRWYLIAVFIYISLMIKDGEHIFMCLFFEKMSTQILSPFLKIGLFGVLMLTSMNSLCLLDINPLSYILSAFTVRSFLVWYPPICLSFLLFALTEETCQYIHTHTHTHTHTRTPLSESTAYVLLQKFNGFRSLI